jgi:serine phosphatase RsbU (regulator of sigma subunit)
MNRRPLNHVVETLLNKIYVLFSLAYHGLVRSRLFLIVLIFLRVTNLSAQVNTDSIIKLLDSNPHDSVKFSCYDELTWNKLSTNTDSALIYAKLALQYASKSGIKAKIATAYSTLSSVHYYKNKIDPAIEYALKSYEIRKTFPDKTAATKSLNNLAIMYEANGELDKAMELLLDADKNLQANNYIKSCIKNNIGGLYKKKGKYKDALDQFIAALRLKESSAESDKKDKAETLGNISGIYKDLNDLKKSRFYLEKAYGLSLTTNDIGLKSQLMDQMGILCRNEKNYDCAISYYKEALVLKKQFGNPTMISQSLVNIGTLLMAQKKYAEALKFTEEAIEIKRKENDKLGLSIALNNYGIIVSKLGKPAEGISAVKESIRLSEELNERENRVNSFKTMSEIYETMRDDKNALIWIKKMIELKDTMLNAESNKQIAEMETKYQSDKKEQEIKLLNKDKDIQSKEIALKNSQRNVFIVAFLLTIILAAFVFRSLQQNKKKNKIITQQKREVEESKAIIEHQKELVDEKQKEILDSIHYAKRIQSALLASEKILDTNLNGKENYFVYFRPKDIVSGDFYWATHVQNKQGHDLFFIACCDSTGHGVPGAFMSLLNTGFLSEAIKEKDIFKPNEIFNYVRKRLVESISTEGQKDGFDGILICFNREDKTLTYAAANNAPVLSCESGMVFLPADKMPVGKGESEQSFTLHSIEYKQGDQLYLYTDGYPDQFGGPKGKKFKYKQLEQLLQSNRELKMQDQVARLEKEFIEWKGALEQVDDVLVIGIKL